MSTKPIEITREQFKDYFEYDPTSPSYLRWTCTILVGKMKNRKIVVPGQIAGSINNRYGYYQVRLNRKTYRVHRIVYALFHGVCEAEAIDHIDGNKTNNDIENLRIASLEDNAKNKLHSSSNFLPYSHINKQGTRVQVALVMDGKRKCITFLKTKYGSIENACVAAREFLNKELENFIRYGYTQRQIDFVKKKIEDSYNNF